MINSVSSMSTQSTDYWKKLLATKNKNTSTTYSDDTTEQLTATSSSTASSEVSLDNLFGMMQSSIRPEISMASTSITETESNTETTVSTASAQTDNILSSIDADEDGSISTDEFSTLLEKLGIESNTTIEDFFTQADTNSDGELSIDELRAVAGENKPPMAPPPELRQAIPEDIDADADGTVSADEYDTLVSQMGVNDALSSDEFFKKYDTNSDGEISADEIIAALNAANQSTTTQSTESENDNTLTQNDTEQTLSTQYKNIAAKMLSAYEKNYEYMFDLDSDKTGSVA